MNQLHNQFTAGADPEMFCKRNGEYVPVQECGIRGTKYEPQQLPSGGNVQRDNVAIEFAIAPANTKQEFINNINVTMAELLQVLPPDVDVDIVPSADFPVEKLNHKECREFACSPDFSAWKNGEANTISDEAKESTFRSCGGHFHIGFVEGSKYEMLTDEYGKMMVIKAMDVFPGLISTVIDNSKAAIDRRKLYGKAGCYRPTDYGVEYRTLSNFWIKDTKLTELIYNLTQDALDACVSGKLFDIIHAIGPENIQKTIENGDSKSAKEYIDKYIVQHMSEDSVSLFNEVLNNG